MNSSVLRLNVLLLSIVFCLSTKTLCSQVNDSADSTEITRLLNQSELMYLRNVDSAKQLNYSGIKLIKASFKKNKHLKSDHPFILALHSNYSAALNNVGYIELQQGNIELGKKLYKQAIGESRLANDKVSIGVSYNNLGYVHFMQGQVELAQTYYQKSLDICEKYKNYKDMCNTLCNMAYLLETIGDNQLAKEYYERALKASVKGKERRTEATVMNNLAFMHKEAGEEKKALELYSKSLEIFTELQDDIGIGTIRINIGKINLDRNLNEIALRSFEESVPFFEKADDPSGLASAYECISRAHLKLKNYKKGIEAGEKALKLSTDIGFTEDMSNAAYGLFLLYEATGEFKQALKMHVLHTQLEDSIKSREIHDNAVKEQMRYEFVKKHTADSIGHAEAGKIKDAQIAERDARHERDRWQKLLLFGGVGILIVLALVIFRAYSSKQKDNALILAQKKEVENQKILIEEKNKEIVDSIHYAKRIQQALMPRDQYFEKNLGKKSGKK